MSLVGNLEDLSLGDIMQIISLSQKSGVLALKGEEGAGRIVFRSGLVHAACLEGHTADLRGLLLSSHSIDAATFDAFAAHAAKTKVSLVEVLVAKSSLTSETIDGLLRASVESSILEMFSWPTGDFSFDVRTQLDRDDPQLILSVGINAQYLVMEGMRIGDERSRDEAAFASGTASEMDQSAKSEPSAQATGPSQPSAEPEEFEFVREIPEVGGDVPVPSALAHDQSSAADVLVATVLSSEDASEIPFAVTIEAETAESHVDVAKAIDSTPPSAPATAPSRGVAESRRVPLVLIDSDVDALDWAKGALRQEFSRIHTFQQAEQGLARIRQYLIRGEFPVVLIATDMRIDPLSGIHGLSDFVSRLKAQAAKLVVLGLQENQDPTVTRPAIARAFDAVFSRPTGHSLRSDDGDSGAEAAVRLAEAIRARVVAGTESPVAKPVRTPEPAANAIRHLRDATAKLQEASSRGEILPVVLDFASEIFARVAILIVREEQVFVIAGRGIDALEVDPLDSLPVSLQTLNLGWIRQVLESRGPVEGPPTTDADRDLLARFGGVVPVSAYLGPIESAGSTVAMLYCDQGSAGSGIPDTSGLEVVLQHAGLALDRAALERALWEVDSETR